MIPRREAPRGRRGLMQLRPTTQSSSSRKKTRPGEFSDLLLVVGHAARVRPGGAVIAVPSQDERESDRALGVDPGLVEMVGDDHFGSIRASSPRRRQSLTFHLRAVRSGFHCL